MMDWFLLLAPLPVAAFLLLFRFVGCVLNTEGLAPEDPIPDPPPDYGAAMLAEADLVAYWRLGEPAGTSAGDPALDQKGAHPGTYTTADLAADPGLLSPETAHPPILAPGEAGLLDSAPALTSVQVDGGYVGVPWASALNPPKTPGFTVEAWVRPAWPAAETGVFRCVVASREDLSIGGRHGYVLYAGPQLDPVTFAIVDPAMRWQAWVGDGAQWRMLVGPPVQVDLTTYLLVTYDGATETLVLYAVNESIDLDSYAPANMSTSYSPNPGKPLYLGMGAPERAVPSPGPLYPFLGRIQEVAVYESPLGGPSFTAHVRAGFGI
jgi:hypothetical protein